VLELKNRLSAASWTVKITIHPEFVKHNTSKYFLSVPIAIGRDNEKFVGLEI
jgi:hypothetical protein